MKVAKAQKCIRTNQIFEMEGISMKSYEIFVSPSGSDSNCGSIDSPLRTPEAACVLVASLPKTDKVTVYFREGDYPYSLNLDAESSGSGENPVTYSAYGNETVRFIGGFKVERDRFSRVTDTEILSRIIDEGARERIVRIDLSDRRECLYPMFKKLDRNTTAPFAIFSCNTTMEPARYPKRMKKANEWGPYLRSEEVYYEKKNKQIIDIPITEETAQRMSMWNERVFDNLWMHGYMGANWYDESARVIGHDFDKRTITTDERGFIYLPTKVEPRRMKMYFSNVFDELGAANEYYIDYEKGYVYICPDDADNIPDIYIGVKNAPLLTVSDAKNIEIKNIQFMYTHGAMAKISYSENVVIEDCTFAHSVSKAMMITKSRAVKISHCDIYDFGMGGIHAVDCGNVFKLESSKIEISNCVIHDVSNIVHCYMPCIRMNCCGADIINNTFYSSPHNLINFGHSQNINIAYNEFYDGVADTDDAGVIYWGRAPHTLGIKIHDNYFHHNTNDYATFCLGAVYQDDMCTGAEIYRNIFYLSAATRRPVIVGSQMHHTFNNIFIQKQRPISGYAPGANGDAWALSCAGAYTANKSEAFGGWGSLNKWHELLVESGFFTSYWRNYFKGTFWERAYDILSEDKLRAIEDYKKTVTGLPDDLQNAKIRQFALDLYWTHELKNGERYEGSVWDYIKENVPEEYARVQEETEGKGEAAFIQALCNLERQLHDTHIEGLRVIEYHNNLSIGVGKEFWDGDNLVTYAVMQENNYNMEDDKMPSGESIFVRFGEDFTLTDKGLEFVRSHIKDFEPTDLSIIGAGRQKSSV